MQYHRSKKDFQAFTLSLTSFADILWILWDTKRFVNLMHWKFYGKIQSSHLSYTVCISRSCCFRPMNQTKTVVLCQLVWTTTKTTLGIKSRETETTLLPDCEKGSYRRSSIGSPKANCPFWVNYHRLKKSIDKMSVALQIENGFL